MCTMSLSYEENADHGKMHARNVSTLSTESSEFEFQFHDETPLSPKLLLSPDYSIYTPTHFAPGESALKRPTNGYGADIDYTHNEENHFWEEALYSAGRHHTHEGFTPSTNAVNLELDGVLFSLSVPNSESDGDSHITRALCNNQEELWGKFGHNRVDEHFGNADSEAPSSVSRANEGRRGTSLGSLLNRRNLEQLSTLTDYQSKENSTSAVSPSSAPSDNHATQPPNPCKCEDYCPDSAEGSASSPDSKSSKRKSRRWSFNLDFLRKSTSPRMDQVNRRASSDNYVEALNQGMKSTQYNACNISEAAEEAGLEYRRQERNDQNGSVTPREAGNQRIDQYRAPAAASEARFERLSNQILSINHSAAGGHPPKGSDPKQGNIEKYCVDTAAWITRYESPRQSTGSGIFSVSSSPRHTENEMIRANHKRISRSAPLSSTGRPVQSSPRAAASDQAGFTRGRPPRSPHALHYAHKKAREDESRRKTFLPYRQSLLGACLFPIETHAHNPQQTVF